MLNYLRPPKLRTFKALSYRSYATRSHGPFKILFFGFDEFSCGVMDVLHKANDVWDEIHIGTQPNMMTGRRRGKETISALKLRAQELGLPVHHILPERKEFKHWQLPSPFTSSVYPLPEHHVLVTASFGRILPKSMLEKFSPYRRLNVHPSLLPAYRGPAPIHRAIMDGHDELGCSIISMKKFSEGIDTGEIWKQERWRIEGEPYFPAVRDKLASLGGTLLVQVLRDMREGKAQSRPQLEDPHALYAPFISTEDSCPNFQELTASQILRRHFALSYRKPIFGYIPTGQTVQFFDLSVVESDSTIYSDVSMSLHQPGSATFHKSSKRLLIRCADDTLLSVPKV
ncbi:Formyltransferase [Abortiporus biennis]|nr:Formyltransferase [Abortiporus biennis]